MRATPARLSAVLALTVIASAAFAADPFAGLWRPKRSPSWTPGEPPPAATNGAVTVRIHESSVVRPVPPALFGNNCAVWNGDGRLLTAKTDDSLRRAGIRVLRFPGGSTSDQFHWDGDYAAFKAAYPNDTSDPWVMNQDWAVSTDEFIQTCRRVGAEPMITVNLGYARYGSLQQAVDLAARWVRYCNVDHDYDVRYWEVGNENYGDWERGTVFPPNSGQRLDGAQYGEAFNQFAAAMKAVDPTIAIGAVSVGTDAEDPYVGYFGWMRRMLPIVQDSADFLSVHEYFIWLGGTAQTTPKTILGNAAMIARIKANLDAMIPKYTDKQAGDIPYAMTEYNCENPPKHDTVEMTNGLFTAIALGEFASSGWSAANYWDVYNGWDASTLGDHAFLATGQPGVAEGTQRAPLYAFALWSLFGDTLVESASSDTAVKAYAGTYWDGGACALLVNTSQSARVVTVETGSPISGRANLWALSGDAYTASQVRWNGVAGPAGGGPQALESIPPYSLAAGGGAFSVPLSPYTAALLVIDPGGVPGDIDGDGAVTLADASLCARFTAGVGSPAPAERGRADMDRDTDLDLRDLALILAGAAGLAQHTREAA